MARTPADFAKANPGDGETCGKMAEESLKYEKWNDHAPGRLHFAAAALLAILDCKDAEHAQVIAKNGLTAIEYWNWEEEYPEVDWDEDEED